MVALGGFLTVFSIVMDVVVKIDVEEFLIL